MVRKIRYWLKFKTAHCMAGISVDSEPSWIIALRILTLQPIFLYHVLMSLYVLYCLLPMCWPHSWSLFAALGEQIFAAPGEQICSPRRTNSWCLCADPHCLASCVAPNFRSINIIDSPNDEFEAIVNTTFFLRKKNMECTVLNNFHLHIVVETTTSFLTVVHKSLNDIIF